MKGYGNGRGCIRGSVTGGLLFMTLGVILLLNNLNLVDGSIGRWWPVLLIVMGVSRLMTNRTVNGR